jgi:hypothetical protein
VADIARQSFTPLSSLGTNAFPSNNPNIVEPPYDLFGRMGGSGVVSKEIELAKKSKFEQSFTNLSTSRDSHIF